MRRAVVALLAAAVLAPAAGAEAKPRKPSARPCAAAWTKPSKFRPLAARRRCVKPRGHAAAPATPAPSAPGAAAPAAVEAGVAPAAAPEARTCDASPWLGAIAEDVGGFRLRLTRTCVRAGRVLVNFTNRDLQPHNLYAEGVAPAVASRRILADLDAESTSDGEVDLPAGDWRIYCAIAGHEAMTRRLDVIAPPAR